MDPFPRAQPLNPPIAHAHPLPLDSPNRPNFHRPRSALKSTTHLSFAMVQSTLQKRFGGSVDPNSLLSKIVSLHLSGKGLESLIPLPPQWEEAATGQPKLKLSKALSFLKNCPNLSSLYLDNNSLCSLVGVDALPLKTLHVHNNNLTHTEDLRGLSSLQVLSLSHNPIARVSLPPGCMLKELIMSHVVPSQPPAGDSGDGRAGGYASGEDEVLSSPLLPDSADAGAGASANTSVSRIRDSAGTGVGAGGGGDWCGHVTFTPESIVAMKYVQTLDLSNCGISSILDLVPAPSSDTPEDADAEAPPPPSLLSLHHLTHLDLSFNHIHNPAAVVELCKACPALQSLNLTGNPVCKSPRLREMIIVLCSRLTVLDEKSILITERQSYMGKMMHRRALNQPKPRRPSLDTGANTGPGVRPQFSSPGSNASMLRSAGAGILHNNHSFGNNKGNNTSMLAGNAGMQCRDGYITKRGIKPGKVIHSSGNGNSGFSGNQPGYPGMGRNPASSHMSSLYDQYQQQRSSSNASGSDTGISMPMDSNNSYSNPNKYSDSPADALSSLVHSPQLAFDPETALQPRPQPREPQQQYRIVPVAATSVELRLHRERQAEQQRRWREQQQQQQQQQRYGSGFGEAADDWEGPWGSQ